MAIFEGAGVALITPFKANGEVNYDKLEEIVEEQIAGGTDAIVACGTTGEASTMTHEEHLDVIKFVCEVTKKRIPVIAGTGSNCTETAIYLSQEADSLTVLALGIYQMLLFGYLANLILDMMADRENRFFQHESENMQPSTPRRIRCPHFTLKLSLRNSITTANISTAKR